MELYALTGGVTTNQKRVNNRRYHVLYSVKVLCDSRLTKDDVHWLIWYIAFCSMAWFNR